MYMYSHTFKVYKKHTNIRLVLLLLSPHPASCSCCGCSDFPLGINKVLLSLNSMLSVHFSGYNLQDLLR